MTFSRFLDIMNSNLFKIMVRYLSPLTNVRLLIRFSNPTSRFSQKSVRIMVFKATLNNISAISWRSVWLVEESRVKEEAHRSAASGFLSITMLINTLWLSQLIAITNMNYQRPVWSPNSFYLKKLKTRAKKQKKTNQNDYFCLLCYE